MTTKTLGDALFADSRAPRLARNVMMIAAGVAALWISAKIKVAVEPVPVTMQTLVVMAIGVAYGARLGVATILTYLALGAIGEPVFAGTPEKGLGLGYMLGSTGGYLIGFAAAAGLVGWLAERGWDRSVFSLAAAMALGLAALYGCGVAWLAFGFPLTAFGSAFAGIGLENALAFGVTPFLWIDALKLSLAVVAFPAIWALFDQRG